MAGVAGGGEPRGEGGGAGVVEEAGGRREAEADLVATGALFGPVTCPDPAGTATFFFFRHPYLLTLISLSLLFKEIRLMTSIV
jgi:hypothetical protein